MKKLVMFALMAVFLVALPVSSLAKLKAPDVLDKEKIKTDESLSRYESVGVKISSSEDIEYENVDDDEKSKMKGFLKDCKKKMARAIVRNLDEDGVKAFVIGGDDEEGSGKADMVIEVSITKVNMGSAVGRAFWGWGAGQAGLSVKGKLVDVKSGDSLAEFEHENTSGLGDGYKWDLVMREAEDVGDKIAEFVHKLRR